MKIFFVSSICLLAIGCNAVRVNDTGAAKAEVSSEEAVCLSCHVFTEKMIKGNMYYCWRESRNNEKDAIFNLSSVDESKQFFIKKGEMLCEKNGEYRLHPSEKPIRPRGH